MTTRRLVIGLIILTFTLTFSACSGGLSKNKFGMEFVKVPAGEFMMGSMDSPMAQEKPVHKVAPTKDFWLGTTEVTQAQWLAVMDKMPAKCNDGSLQLTGNFLGERKPIVCVSWEEAQQFVGKLNAQNDGSNYRLPTEAEWEYACRGEETTKHIIFDSMAWFMANADKQTHEVATKKPTKWGLYDMLGNVSEWVHDEYDPDYYNRSPVNDPQGPPGQSIKVARGGSFLEGGDGVSCTVRPNSFSKSDRLIGVGFRLVREAR